MAVVGLIFSIAFMVLQLIPIPGLEGVHFGKESYILLIVWVVLGVIFYIKQRKAFWQIINYKVRCRSVSGFFRQKRQKIEGC